MDYYMINGIAVLSAAGIMGIIGRHGLQLELLESTDRSATARVTFADIVEAHATYAIEDARAWHARAGMPLSEPWRRHPANMLKSAVLRCCADQLDRKNPGMFGVRP